MEGVDESPAPEAGATEGATPMESEASAVKDEEIIEAREEEEEVPPHPPADLLANFKPTSSQLETGDPIVAPSLNDTPFSLVATKEELSAAMVKLKEATPMESGASAVKDEEI